MHWWVFLILVFLHCWSAFYRDTIAITRLTWLWAEIFENLNHNVEEPCLNVKVAPKNCFWVYPKIVLTANPAVWILNMNFDFEQNILPKALPCTSYENDLHSSYPILNPRSAHCKCFLIGKKSNTYLKLYSLNIVFYSTWMCYNLEATAAS